jgi:hypothetical protein
MQRVRNADINRTTQGTEAANYDQPLIHKIKAYEKKSNNLLTNTL